MTSAAPKRIAVFAFSTYAIFFREAIKISHARGDNVDWSAIIPRAPFRRAFDDLLAPEKRLYLYQDFNAVYASRPALPALRGAEDNIARLLACDKDGYRHERAPFQERCAATMLHIFRDFLERFKPDCVVFPPLETVDAALLFGLCQSMRIRPAYMVHLRNLGRSIFSESLYETPPPYFGAATTVDREAAISFIEGFRQGQRRPGDMPLPASAYDAPIPFRAPPLPVRVLRYMIDTFGTERLHRGEDRLPLRIKMNILRPLYAFRRAIYRLTRERNFDLTPKHGALPERFILYASQVTPESSINTLAQFFVDQKRVIDLLRLHMPAGYSLVVKEHPAMAGSRPRSEYDDLHRLPGVVLASPDVPMRDLVERADLVASVTGTVGLECFLMGKPCLLFGRTFFSHLCERPAALDQLQDQLQTLASNPPRTTEDDRVEAMARLFNVAYDFAPFEPIYQPEARTVTNISGFLDGLLHHLDRLQDSPPHHA